MLSGRSRCIADVGDGWLIGEYHQIGPAMFFDTSVEIERLQHHDPVEPGCPLASDQLGSARGRGQGHGVYHGGAAEQDVQNPPTALSSNDRQQHIVTLPHSALAFPLN